MTARTLADAIQIEGLTGSAAEIRAALDVDVFTPDNTRRDWSYVSGLLLSAGVTAQQIDAFYTGLESITGGISLRAAMLSTTKADFSLPEIQAGIEAARAQLGPIADILKGIGGSTSKRWQRCGLSALPTEVEVQAAIDHVAEPVVYDRRRVLLSLSRGDVDAVSVRVQASTSDGRLGDVLATIATADSAAAQLNGPEKIFVDAIRLAVDEYLGAI